jgi:hypothetical protein
LKPCDISGRRNCIRKLVFSDVSSQHSAISFQEKKSNYNQFADGSFP